MPEDVEQSAPEVNTVDATEDQKIQADQEINQDPTVEDPAVEPEVEPEAEPGVYDDEEAFPYRKLQALAKERELDASGKREEIVARLEDYDAAQAVEPAADQVVNGGIAKDTAYSAAHAETLQELSNARRAAQLKAVSD